MLQALTRLSHEQHGVDAGHLWIDLPAAICTVFRMFAYWNWEQQKRQALSYNVTIECFICTGLWPLHCWESVLQVLWPLLDFGRTIHQPCRCPVQLRNFFFCHARVLLHAVIHVIRSVGPASSTIVAGRVAIEGVLVHCRLLPRSSGGPQRFAAPNLVAKPSRSSRENTTTLRLRPYYFAVLSYSASSADQWNTASDMKLQKDILRKTGNLVIWMVKELKQNEFVRKDGKKGSGPCCSQLLRSGDRREKKLWKQW